MENQLSPDTLNKYFPIGAVVINRETKAAVVMRKGSLNGTSPQTFGNKKAIRFLSQSSLNELLFLTVNTASKFQSLLTLTFLSPPLAAQAKVHLNKFLVYLRRKIGTTLRYLWFMEFQLRGAIHFHILLNQKYQKPLHMSMAEYWGRCTEPLNVGYYSLVKCKNLMTQETVIAFHKDERGVWENIRKKDGMIRYVAKYAMKTTQKKPPKWLNLTGRFWGSDRKTGNIDWAKFEVKPMNEETMRMILSDQDHPTKDFDVIPKYLFNFIT